MVAHWMILSLRDIELKKIALSKRISSPNVFNAFPKQKPETKISLPVISFRLLI